MISRYGKYSTGDGSRPSFSTLEAAKTELLPPSHFVFPLIEKLPSRAGASDAVVGPRPSAGDVDWPRGAVAAGLLVDTLGCSSIAHGRNGCRRRRRRHTHDSYGFGAQPRTWTSLVPITLHQTTMMRACGDDDAEVFTPADVQKTTFSDDR